MYDTILSKVKTQEDKERLKNELDMLLERLFEKDNAIIDSLLKYKIPKWLSDILRDRFSEVDLDKEKFLRGLSKELDSIPIVELVLAFEPSQEIIETFVGYLTRAIGQNVIIKITIDPNIIGGVQIIFNGKFRDFSFKRIFEKEFEESREGMLGLLPKSKITEEPESSENLNSQKIR